MKNMEYKDKVVIVNGGAQAAMTIDTTNLCSHLQKKLFEPEGVYYPIWQGSAEDAILMWAMRKLWNRSTIQTRSM